MSQSGRKDGKIKHGVMAFYKACALIGMFLVTGLAQAAWPDKPVTFIVPFPPGGPVDTTARLTTVPLSQLWSVATPIDNKAGAGGIVGAQAAAKAAAGQGAQRAHHRANH